MALRKYSLRKFCVALDRKRRTSDKDHASDTVQEKKMTETQIHEFLTIEGQIQAFYTEMNTLVRKSPNDALNSFKLNLVNSVIKRSNAFLGKKRLPFGDFVQFDEQSLPSTSDVLVVIAQYISAFEKLRVENIIQNFGDWYWMIDGKDSNWRTSPPKVLQK